MGCGNPRKHPRSRREGVPQGDHRGSDRRLEGHGQVPDRSKALRLPRAEFKFRLSDAGPGPLTERGGPCAHFLTRLRAALKGQLSGCRLVPRRSGARREVCTCAHRPVLFFRESPEIREGFASAIASPIFWKVLSFSPPPALSVPLVSSDRLDSVRYIFTIFPENEIPPFRFWKSSHPNQPLALGSPHPPPVAPTSFLELRPLGKTLLQSSPFFLPLLSPLPDLVRRT